MAPINDAPEFSQEEVGLALHNPGTQPEATAGHRGATSGTPAPASTTCARATDASGKTQPVEGGEVRNQGGCGINIVQRVLVQVG